jgi:hypothetical protein
LSEEDAMTDVETQTLRAVLDELIPPSADGELPGAGGLGLEAHVAAWIERMPALGSAVASGLAAIAAAAETRAAGGFVALDRDARLAVLRAVEAAEPAFLPALTFLAYTGYYHQAPVLEALGVEPRPPHPQGYEIPPSDLDALLAPVRERGAGYRKG